MDQDETVWAANMVQVLTRELPRLRLSALRVLSLVETHKISHPYWKHMHKHYKYGWTRMQESLETMRLTLDIPIIEPNISLAKEDFDSDILKQEQMTLNSSFDKVWDALHGPLRATPKWARTEAQRLARGWLYVKDYLDDMIELRIPREENWIFCCKLKCFLLSNETAEGSMCKDCHSRGICFCDCVTYMERMHDTHCCPLFCTAPELGICLLCPGACLCKCVKHQNEMMKRDGVQTIRINDQVMEVCQHPEVAHCCENKCFVIPNNLIRGLVCKYCNAVNFCKCACVAWKNRKFPKRYLKKPTPGGWQIASEKDYAEFNTLIETVRNTPSKV